MNIEINTTKDLLKHYRTMAKITERRTRMTSTHKIKIDTSTHRMPKNDTLQSFLNAYRTNTLNNLIDCVVRSINAIEDAQARAILYTRYMVEPRAKHEDLAKNLGLSVSTYYRRLSQSMRLFEEIAESGCDYMEN